MQPGQEDELLRQPGISASGRWAGLIGRAQARHRSGLRWSGLSTHAGEHSCLEHRFDCLGVGDAGVAIDVHHIITGFGHLLLNDELPIPCKVLADQPSVSRQITATVQPGRSRVSPRYTR